MCCLCSIFLHGITEAFSIRKPGNGLKQAKVENSPLLSGAIIKPKSKLKRYSNSNHGHRKICRARKSKKDQAKIRRKAFKLTNNDLDDYVDFGALIGQNGAFSWHANYSVKWGGEWQFWKIHELEWVLCMCVCLLCNCTGVCFVCIYFMFYKYYFRDTDIPFVLGSIFDGDFSFSLDSITQVACSNYINRFCSFSIMQRSRESSHWRRYVCSALHFMEHSPWSIEEKIHAQYFSCNG